MDDKPGETTFKADGKEYRVAFDWNTGCDFEDAAGKPVSSVLAEIAEAEFSARSARAMVWAGLRLHHGDVDLQAAGRLLGVIGRQEAQRIAGVALRFYFPELGAEDAPPSSVKGA